MAQTQWNFQNNPMPIGSILGKIHFVSSTEGWISASNGKLLHTTDAGLTWNTVIPFPNDIVSTISDPSFSMSWVNKTHGWVMNTLGTDFTNANGAVIQKTVDGGNIWTKKELPKTISTITYTASDLQGTWQWHELVSAKKSSLPTSWIGWGHGKLNVDGNGNGLFSDVIKSDGILHAGSAVSISIKSGGEITEGEESHGFMSADKKTIFLTSNDKRGGYKLGIGQKLVAETTYSIADLQGIWQMHVLSAGDITGRYAGWGHAKMTADGNGNMTGTWFGPDNGQGILSSSVSISSTGVISGFGPENAGNHGYMSADKKSFIMTMTGSNEAIDYNIVIFQKQVSGTTYSATDLKGSWQIHELTADNVNDLNVWSSWTHGRVVMDETGKGLVTNLVENGSVLSDRSRSISITSEGILSGSWAPDLHGFMNSDKSLGVYTKTDGTGGYTLTALQKENPVKSGDIGAQVQFVDENKGWASAFNIQTRKGQLFKTTDGGNNWAVINSLPATDEVTIFYFVDGNTGWMTSINDDPPLFRISKTTDGGSSWTAQYADTTPNADTLSSSGAMQFTDSNHGWVVGSNGRILKTINGGATWELLTNAGIGATANSKCLFFLDANTGWIGTNISGTGGTATQRVLLHTKDGGLSWTKQNFADSDALFSIYFSDTKNGWLTAEKCMQNCSGPDSLKVYTGLIGHTTIGGTNAVGEGHLNEQINIYPNPSKNTLYIDGVGQNSTVSIIDTSGKTLIDKQIINNQIDISSLFNGIYIVRIVDSRGITMRKFLKQ